MGVFFNEREYSGADWLVPLLADPGEALKVEDGGFSNKKGYVTILKENLNPESHPNLFTGSKVKEILLNWWIFPVG